MAFAAMALGDIPRIRARDRKNPKFAKPSRIKGLPTCHLCETFIPKQPYWLEMNGVKQYYHQHCAARMLSADPLLKFHYEGEKT